MAGRENLSALCIGLMALLIALGDANAKPASQVARAAAERAVKKLKAGDYAGAAVEFRAAYRAEPLPEFLYAQGQSEKLAGDCKGALKRFELFLATAPSESDRKAAQRSIEECQLAVITQEENAQPEQNGLAGPPRPERSKAAARIGQPNLRAEHAELRKEPLEADSALWSGDILGWTLGVGGVAGLAVAGGIWASALSNKRRAESAELHEHYVSLADTAERRGQVAAVTGAAGGVLLALSAARFLWVARSQSEPPSVVIRPSEQGWHAAFHYSF